MCNRPLLRALTAFPIAIVLVVSACGQAASLPKAASTVATKPTVEATSSPAAAATANPTPTLSTAAPVTLSFGMIPAVPAAPNYVALDKGYLKEEGIDLSIHDFPDTVQIMTLIATGKLQIGPVTLGAAAFNSFARKTDMIIVAGQNQEPNGPGSLVPLVVRKDLYDSGQIRTVADLKGKKVALNGRGTVLEWAMAKLLEKGNLKLEDVDIPLLAWPDMVIALSNKAIDAGLIGEPLATKAVEQGVGVKLVDDYVPYGQYGVILVNKVFAKENPLVVRNYLVAYVKAIREMNDGKFKDDPEDLEIISKYTKVPVDVIKKMPAPYWDPNGRVNKDSVMDIQRFLLQRKSVHYTDPLPISAILDESYLEQALAIAGTVPRR